MKKHEAAVPIPALTPPPACFLLPPMSESAEPTTPPESQKPLDALVEKAALEVRRQPVKSAVWAFFIGILLAAFPLGRVLGALTTLAFSLLRPVLLLLGVVKVCEEIETRRK